MVDVFAVITGYALDIVAGDPQNIPHPVRMMGSVISRGERFLRRFGCGTKAGQLVSGAVLTVFVSGISYMASFLVLVFLERASHLAAFLAQSFMCYQLLATKSLRDESMKVYLALEKGDLSAARRALSRIVGRDTENLDETGISRAAIETVAENTTDGVIAPLFYMIIGGAPLGFFYKAVSTLDSMIGYKNEKYLYFGRFAARLDDVLNYVPARISAFLMIISSFLAGYDAKNAIRVYLRDRGNHQSPNSAHTEAVCAGALNIQLAGDSFYFGKLVRKKTIGDHGRDVERDDIRRSHALLYATSFLGAVMGAGICAVVRFMA
ncbi:MAG: cobalamin biosynthesis protein CobD [Oligoflexales bacterium]|nr:cobalamin biosynthesis protein CobD [Oligoflexales bacterium]